MRTAAPSHFRGIAGEVSRTTERRSTPGWGLFGLQIVVRGVSFVLAFASELNTIYSGIRVRPFLLYDTQHFSMVKY